MNDALQITFTQAATHHSFGMPEERAARLAARQAFVEMKTCFMRAAAIVEGSAGALLQRKVRLSSEVMELWRLSDSLFAALPHGQAIADQHRFELKQQLDSAFPEGGGNTQFVPLALS